MVQEQKSAKDTHALILENRRSLNISGVCDVDSFDDKIILVYTNLGELTIKGSDLHINKLNLESGEILLEGTILSLVYTDNESKKLGLFSKIFK
jgi:sporulation protein YabP